MPRKGQLLIWLGGVGIIAVAGLSTWTRIQGAIDNGYEGSALSSWDAVDPLPVGVYAAVLAVLAMLLALSTWAPRGSLWRALLAGADLGIVLVAWVFLRAKPPEILGLPEAAQLTVAAGVLLLGLMLEGRQRARPLARQGAELDTPDKEPEAPDGEPPYLTVQAAR